MSWVLVEEDLDYGYDGENEIVSVNIGDVIGPFPSEDAAEQWRKTNKWYRSWKPREMKAIPNG